MKNRRNERKKGGREEGKNEVRKEGRSERKKERRCMYVVLCKNVKRSMQLFLIFQGLGFLLVRILLRI